MKKIYTAPEAELLCFRPVEALATDAVFDMEDLLGNEHGNQTPAGDGASDVIIDW